MPFEVNIVNKSYYGQTLFIALEKTETALENYLVFNHGIVRVMG